MTSLLRAIWEETFGLFVDDGAQAVLCTALIVIVSVSVELLGVPSLYGALAVLAGCGPILAFSVARAVRSRPKRR